MYIYIEYLYCIINYMDCYIIHYMYIDIEYLCYIIHQLDIYAIHIHIYHGTCTSLFIMYNELDYKYISCRYNS